MYAVLLFLVCLQTKEAFKGCEEYFHLSGVTESVQRVRNVVKTLQFCQI
nr:hypothetical protein Iba_chr13aCG6750 [Ipomoea batatas]